MAPRTGQLDEISEAIGRLAGQFEGLEKYIHNREHNIANLTQAVNGVGALVSREVARLKAELQTDLDNLNERVRKLEQVQQQQAGAKNLASWFLQSPLIGWLVAVGLFVASIWKGDR